MTNFVQPNFDMSFDEWVKFIFNHPVSDDIKSAWYWDDQLNEFWDKWIFSEERIAERQLEYATRLFQDSAFLLAISRVRPVKSLVPFWRNESGTSQFYFLQKRNQSNTGSVAYQVISSGLE